MMLRVTVMSMSVWAVLRMFMSGRLSSIIHMFCRCGLRSIGRRSATVSDRFQIMFWSLRMTIVAVLIHLQLILHLGHILCFSGFGFLLRRSLLRLVLFAKQCSLKNSFLHVPLSAGRTGALADSRVLGWCQRLWLVVCRWRLTSSVTWRWRRFLFILNVNKK